MGKEKSELEIIKDYMYEIRYGLRTIGDGLKIRVWIHSIESVSPVNCRVGDVYFGDDKTLIYSTDITDLRYCMEKVRDFITRNFKTELG